MSTEIKPGMQGRAVRDTASMGGTKIPQSTVVTVTALPAEPDLFVGGNGKQMGMTLRVDDFLFVPVYDDATPAPLDPSKGGPFGGGDSVRYVGPPHRSYVAAGVIPGRVFTVRDGTNVENGAISLYGSSGMFPAVKFELVTRATVHQPTPEPEPEPPWPMGTVAEATVADHPGHRVMRIGQDPDAPTGLVWADALGHRMAESIVTDVRPLVVLDPAAARKSLEDNGWGEHETNEILHQLGIEATR